jgi:hypothetical protein
MDRLDILILAANPTGAPTARRDFHGPRTAAEPLSTDPIDFAAEIEKIRERVKASKYRGRVRIEFRLNVSCDNLLAFIDELKPNIIHFIGHSDEAGIGLLGGNNEPVRVSKQALAEVVRLYGTQVRLIVLNSCKSEEIAQDLADVCGCAIGMARKIGDDAALIFASEFYRALASGHSANTACEGGKAALHVRETGQHELPILKCREGVDPSGIGLTTGEVGHDTDLPYPPLPLRSALIAELRKAISGGKLTFEDVGAAYNRFARVGDPCPEGVTGEPLLDWVAEKLCALVICNRLGKHPAVQFAIHLIVRHGVPIRPWLDRFCRHLQIPEVEVDELIEAARNMENRLVITVAPEDEDGRSGYRIKAYSVSHPPDCRDVNLAEVNELEQAARFADESRLEDLPSMVGAAITQAAPAPDAQVEICLPKCVLGFSFDEVLIGKRNPRLHLTQRYSVTARCWERHNDPSFDDDEYLERWRDAWRRFQNGFSQVQRFARDSRANHRSPGDCLANANGRGVLLSFCPTCLVDHTLTVLDHLIEAGVPVALWSRSLPEPGDEFNSPREWRMTVLEHRRREGECLDLTLLWDDPDSVPGRRWGRSRPLTAPRFRST